jgi:transcriptional regulator with XRE-family HTH domain
MKDIGEKLKGIRLATPMTLKQLASRAGCTDAYLSQLERGLINPSIMTLKKIASALQVNIVDFFTQSTPEENDVILTEKERVNILFKEGKSKIQMLVRSTQNKRMQPFFSIISPGGGSKGSISHIGEEFGIVLKGELEFKIDGKPYLVKENQSFYFLSQRLHSWRNPGKKKAVVIWVVSPPTF